MPLVGALEALNDLTAAGLNIAGRPFQGLDRRLFVDAEHQRILRRVQIQADNIGRFRGKLRVGTDAPRAMPAQLNAFVAQHPPTAASETPSAAASVPPSHPANPGGGGNSSCRRRRRRNSAPYLGFLPGRGRSRSPAIPCAANRWRHRPTVFGRTPNSRDTSSFRLPSRQARMILARSTKRASSVRLRARFISSVRCSAEHDNATATRVTRHLNWYANLRYHTKYRTSMQLDTRWPAAPRKSDHPRAG